MAAFTQSSLSGVEVFGRPLLSMGEPSTFWQDGPLLDLKAWPDDVFWAAAGKGIYSEGTLQTEALRKSFFRDGGVEGPVAGPWADCRICTVIYDMLNFCGTSFVYVPESQHFLERLSGLVDFFATTSLADIVLEGWGFAFTTTVIMCLDMAYNHVSGFAFEEEGAVGQEESRNRYSQLFNTALYYAWPKGDEPGDFRADFERAWEFVNEGEQALKEQLVSWKAPSWHWLLWSGIRWPYRLLELSKAWNSGAAGSLIAHDRHRGLSLNGRRHSLRRISRAVRGGWSAAIVALDVVPTAEGATQNTLVGLVDVEFIVVAHELDVHEHVGRWAASTRAFKTVLPMAVLSGLVATAIWRETGSGGHGGERRVPCRVRSQRSIFSGCRKIEGKTECRDHPSEHVSSLRVYCAVPWSLSLEEGTSAKAALELKGGDEDGRDLRIPFTLDSTAREPEADLALCVMPLFGWAAVERRWGDLVGMWLRYHLEVLEGIGHVHLYDIDGSLEAVRTSAARSGRPWPAHVVHLEPEFASRLYAGGLRNLSRGQGCPYCAESLAYDHCLMNARQRARYIVVVHGLDEWLVPAPGSGANLARYVDGLESSNAVLFLRHAGMHHRGLSQSKDLVRSSPWASKVNMTSSFWRGKLFPNLLVRSKGQPSYIDTHVVTYMPRQAMESKAITSRGGPRALRGWWINHFVDFMETRYWDPKGRQFLERPGDEAFEEDLTLADLLDAARIEQEPT
mmetsp:Transcript_28722/g.95387  ORF Transcript_28722/g.95387 Transcript_28722/m.95387 type:complete len:734 (-) Transcript_28722:15-2216(-)